MEQAPIVGMLEPLGKSLDDPNRGVDRTGGSAGTDATALRVGRGHAIGGERRSGCRCRRAGRTYREIATPSRTRGSRRGIETADLGRMRRAWLAEVGERDGASAGLKVPPEVSGSLRLTSSRALTRLPPSCCVGTSPPLARSNRARSAPPK